jgi:hypothetical protein
MGNTTRKPQTRSTAFAQEQMKAIARDVPVPTGYVLYGHAENRLWRTYVQSRALNQWLPADLLTMVKIIKFETQLSKLMEKIEQQGVLIETTDEDGDTVFKENPNLKVYNRLVGLQLMLMRSLALTTSSNEKAVPQRQALAALQKRKDVEDAAEDGLLAVPD